MQVQIYLDTFDDKIVEVTEEEDGTFHCQMENVNHAVGVKVKSDNFSGLSLFCLAAMDAIPELLPGHTALEAKLL